MLLSFPPFWSSVNSYVILGWLSNQQGCFSDHLYVELYLAVFFPPFPEVPFFIVWTCDLVFMFSVSQARKLVIVLSCSFLNHGFVSLMFGSLPPSPIFIGGLQKQPQCCLYHSVDATAQAMTHPS